ncbi:D-alanyl-D-alanine dipeptidase [Candidatus Dependentiae bacterium Noda2021]|nr:D-alanyl-D-alanine dipeptidase [Candidatus Dependentiae bacterium Noda2021]
MVLSRKKLYVAIIGLVSYSHLQQCQTWVDILSNSSPLLLKHQCAILHEQYIQYVSQTALTIANNVIKSIPIVENNEPVVDVNLMAHHRIQMMPNPINGIAFESPAYNSGLPNASKMRKEVYARLEKMIIYLDELAPDFGYQSGDISIRVFEGLRDLKTQEYLFNKKVDEIKNSYPLMNTDEVETEAAKWISPVKNNVPVHSTGAAIDIRLWDEIKQDFLDLGDFGAIWGANTQAPTFSEAITYIQKMNRLLLLMAATKAGLVNYSYEFWHFSYGDRYAAFWTKKNSDDRIACYGSLR